MKILDLLQGTPEWAAVRATKHCASEAAAMMGLDPRVSRNELLAIKKFGVEKDISAFTQKIFDKGHEVEALARPRAEIILGEELFPITATTDDGYLLASLDGLVLDGGTSWECKQWNQALAESVAADIVPDSHWPQLEHQCIVDDARSVFFTVSNGTDDVSCFYNSQPERRAAILAGWKQFDEDIKTFKSTADAPRVTGTAMMALPQLNIEIRGEVLSSNLTLYRSVAIDFIEAIKTDLQDDQDFADAEKAVKWLGDAEKELAAVKKRALAGTATLDELFRTMDIVASAARDKRLTVEKLVAARKTAIRSEIAESSRKVLVGHIKSLETRLGRPMPPVEISFAEVMKGKRTVKSLRDAVDTEVARVKIFANALADIIDANQRALAPLIAGYEFLFRDSHKLTEMTTAGMEAIAKQRIADHHETEARRVATSPSQVVPATQPQPRPASVASWATLRDSRPQAEQHWTFDVIDENVVPREYLQPNTRMIAEAISDGVVIPGIKARLLEASAA